MTTGYRPDAEIDLDALDEIFDGSSQGESRQSVVLTRPVRIDAAGQASPATAGVSPLEGETWTTTDSTAFSTLFRRSARTIAPFLAADVLGLAISGMIAQAIIMWLYPAASDSVGRAAPFALLPLIVAYWLSDLYSEIWVHPVIEFRHLTRVVAVVLVAAAVGGFAVPGLSLWCLLALPCAVALVPLLRTLARHCCVNSNWWGYPTLIIGSGEGAVDIARMLLEVPRSGLRPAMIHDPERACRASFLPVVNETALLESLVRADGIRHAVVALPDLSPARLSEMLDRYGGLIPHLMVLSDTSTLPTLWGASRSSGPISGIEVRNDLLMATLQGMKRCVDIAGSLTAMIIGSPILGAIALLMKYTTPGPIFFGHTRIGRGGKKFKAWKFRTMYINGDEMLKELLERDPIARAEWDRDHKLRDDPRVTPFGKFLRKTSMDELPQIWNVLMGDMSIVGPRPIVDAEVVRYGETFRLYTTVKPGITGLWQVSGRNDLGYNDRVLLDQFYIRHWSPWLDVYITAKTVVALINRDGAY